MTPDWIFRSKKVSISLDKFDISDKKQSKFIQPFDVK